MSFDPFEGLVLFYNMETLTGGQMEDLSGRGNHASLFGPADIAGFIGRARDFVGAENDYMEAPDAASLDINGPLTITAYVKPNLGGQMRFVGKWNTDLVSQWNYGLFRAAGDIAAVGWATTDGTGFRAWGTTGSLPSGVFTHVAAVIGVPTATIYFNAVAQPMQNLFGGTGTSNPVTNDRPLRLGRSSGLGEPGYAPATAVIDEVRVYNRALTAAEVSAVFGDRVAYPVRGGAHGGL